MSMDPMQTPDALNWDPASVQLPEIPMLPPGEDAMSMTISGVLPTLAATMMTSVTALEAKETMFSGKLGSAQSAYENADDQGGQSVGKLGEMLGKLGEMGQQAGAPAQQLGQQAGQFGSMMQQAMQSAQGGGSQGSGSQGGAGSQGGGQPAGGQPSAGQGPGGAGAAPPQPTRDDAATDQEQTQEQRERAEREREGRPPLDHAATGATPGAAPHGAGSAPVAPPHRGDGDSLERSM